MLEMHDLYLSPLHLVAVPMAAVASSLLVWREIAHGPRFVWNDTDMLYTVVLVLAIVSWVLKGISYEAYGPGVSLLAGWLVYVSMRGTTRVSAFVTTMLFLTILGVLWAWCQLHSCAWIDRVMNNRNHFACFLATAAPLLAAATMSAVTVKPSQMLRSYVFSYVQAGGAFIALTMLCLTIVLLVLSTCRTALATGIISLALLAIVGWKNTIVRALYKVEGILPGAGFRGRKVRIILAIASGVFLMCCAACFLQLTAPRSKILSAHGRIMIWGVSLQMAHEHWIDGVGFGNLASLFNIQQSWYFTDGAATALKKMAADNLRHAFSEPLEAVAELGLFGTVLLTLLTVFIGKNVCRVFARQWRMAQHGECSDYISLGMGCAVVAFALASLVHFPRKVVPTFLLFNLALAWIVNANDYEDCLTFEDANERKEGSFSRRWCWRALCLTVLAISFGLLPLYWQRYLAGRKWAGAYSSVMAGDIASAVTVYNQIESGLAWNGRFCAHYGYAVLCAALQTNIGADCMLGQAAELCEQAKYTYPDPYMFENLAVAYLHLADSTNWPVVVQTRYRMETPAQVLMRKLREWRCGTNMFFEPPPTQLTQGDCIGRAIQYLTLASNILPWRLTSKWYLAQIYRDVGDVSNAVKYAQLVVNIPMKKDTPQGREFKRKAQKMLNDLGVQCDDPGMVVFDIRDRKTWNEGKW